MAEIVSSMGVFDYSGNKLCDLFDSQNELRGQAYHIRFSESIADGIKTLEFNIPYMIDEDENFRWKYLRAEYMIRLIYNGRIMWYVAAKPKKSKSGKEVIGSVVCNGVESTLKTKNIYMQFDDENGIGTIDELAGKVLAGTEWELGWVDPMLEKDGVTEKVRSIKSGGKEGALGLMTTLCNLFKCYAVYDSSNFPPGPGNKLKVNLYNFNNRDQVMECVVGQNLNSLSVEQNSNDIITRLYVEGEYGDNGYIGIDSVNPTGLSYIMNFDYYRELGLISPAQEQAITTYTNNISAVKSQISSIGSATIDIEDQLNTLIGQCKVALYYTSDGFTTPKYTYGEPTAEQCAQAAEDEVVVLNNNGDIRYEIIETTASALIRTGDYGIAKFIVPSSGIVGSQETAIKTKDKLIDQYEEQAEKSTKEETIREFNNRIADLETDEALIFGTTTEIDRDAIATQMTSEFPDSNVDLLNRPIVKPRAMRLAGYEAAGGEYATVHTFTYDAGSQGIPWQSANTVINITPIKRDGTVLSKQELDAYLDGLINASNSIAALKQNDTEENGGNNLIIEIMSVTGTYTEAIVRMSARAERLHELQDKYYMPDGLCIEMQRMMKPNGLIAQLHTDMGSLDTLYVQMDDIEADFIIAMGNMLRDGYWSNQNYAPGQEQSLYDDAVDMLGEMSKPATTYTLDYVRMMEDFNIPMEDIRLNAVVRVNDDELEVYDNLFITKITIGVDHLDEGSIEVSNRDITLNSNDLGALLSRMSQLADLIDQKNALYERAKAIQKNGSIYTDRLNGQIDAMKLQILSSVSSWYTDDNGNIMFEAVDGGSAMMLSGNGQLVASDRLENGDWNWRTAIDGQGIAADQIVTGFLSAERIETGSIATNKVTNDFGETLVISANPAITGLNDDVGEIKTQIELLPGQIAAEVARYGRTYIQLTDPCLDDDKEVMKGDYWIVAKLEDGYTWQDEYDQTFQDLANTHNAGTAIGCRDMYCWDGERWVQVFDTATVSEAHARITITEDRILSEVMRANAIEGNIASRISQTADEITLGVIHSGAVETVGSYITIRENLIDINSDGEVNLHSGASMTLDADANMFITAGGKMTIQSDGEMKIDSGGALNIAADGAVNVDAGGNININAGGSLNVTAGQIEGEQVSGEINVSAGGAINVSSGGSMAISADGLFTVNSENFKIYYEDDGYGNMVQKVEIEGTIYADAGDIGGWEVNSSWLWNKGTSTNGFTLCGMGGEEGTVNGSKYWHLKNYFMYCGADYPDMPYDDGHSPTGFAPFRIVRGFEDIRGWTTGTIESRYTCIGNQNYKVIYTIDMQTHRPKKVWAPMTKDDYDGYGATPGFEGYVWVWAAGTKNGNAAHGWREVDLSQLPYKNGWTWGSDFEAGAECYEDP